jgi:hypothetical protein
MFASLTAGLINKEHSYKKVKGKGVIFVNWPYPMAM